MENDIGGGGGGAGWEGGCGVCGGRWGGVSVNWGRRFYMKVHKYNNDGQSSSLINITNFCHRVVSVYLVLKT